MVLTVEIIGNFAQSASAEKDRALGSESSHVIPLEARRWKTVATAYAGCYTRLYQGLVNPITPPRRGGTYWYRLDSNDTYKPTISQQY
jgi:hypothetical protein